MNFREAWDTAAHGQKIRVGEFVIEKWMTDKTDLPLGIDRFLSENHVPAALLFSNEWAVE